MLVMTGASASGKTEIAKIIIHKYHFKKMVTYTTRPMRIGEINGVDYHFLTKEEFIKKQQAGDFLETTEYNHHLYGTCFKDASKDKVLIVDVNGANILHEKLKKQVVIFFLESPPEIRKQRMLQRGDHIDDIEKRLAGDFNDFNPKTMHHIDYIIDTGDETLLTLADQIYNIYIHH